MWVCGHAIYERLVEYPDIKLLDKVYSLVCRIYILIFKCLNEIIKMQ